MLDGPTSRPMLAFLLCPTALSAAMRATSASCAAQASIRLCAPCMSEGEQARQQRRSESEGQQRGNQHRGERGLAAGDRNLERAPLRIARPAAEERVQALGGAIIFPGSLLYLRKNRSQSELLSPAKHAPG